MRKEILIRVKFDVTLPPKMGTVSKTFGSGKFSHYQLIYSLDKLKKLKEDGDFVEFGMSREVQEVMGSR